VAYPEGGTWVNAPPRQGLKNKFSPYGCFATGVTRRRQSACMEERSRHVRQRQRKHDVRTDESCEDRVALGCWAGPNTTSLLRSSAPALQLGSDRLTVTSDHVWVLGVTISSDLSLVIEKAEKHVSKNCAACFYWLRQLRCIRKSLDDESAATLVHAFVTSRVDYCSALYAGSPTGAYPGFL